MEGFGPKGEVNIKQKLGKLFPEYCPILGPNAKSLIPAACTQSYSIIGHTYDRNRDINLQIYMRMILRKMVPQFLQTNILRDEDFEMKK